MQLVKNVHVRDRGWFGPAHGNAVEVPPEVAALITNPAAWDEPPVLSRDGEASTPAPDFGWLGDPTLKIDPHAEQQAVDSERRQLLAELAELTTVGDLEAFAELHKVAVHGEHTDADALRVAIAAALP